MPKMKRVNVVSKDQRDEISIQQCVRNPCEKKKKNARKIGIWRTAVAMNCLLIKQTTREQGETTIF